MAPRRSWILTAAFTTQALLFADTSPVTAQHVLRNDMTGGDCEPGGFGVWEPSSKTCKLVTNVTGTLELASDGLTLDGAGHRLESRAGDRQGVTANGRREVVVKDLALKGFTVGIALLGGSNNRVTGNDIYRGIGPAGGPPGGPGANCGILVDNSNANEIRSNSVIEQRNGAGICLRTARNNTVTENLVVFNDGAEISLHDSDVNTVTHNRSFTGFGFISYGIELRRSHDNAVEWNDAEGYVSGGVGLVDSNRNRIAFNQEWSNPGGGIVLVTSNDNQIFCNDTTTHRFGVDVGAGSAGNVFWKNNHFDQDSAVDAGAPGANRFNLPAPTGGSYWKVNAPACADANADGFCDAPYRFAGNADALPNVQPIPWRIEPGVCQGDRPQQQQPSVEGGSRR